MTKHLVREGYDKAAEAYLSTRDKFNNLVYLQRLDALLMPHSLILDLGCGAGKPIDEYFVKHGHRVIGIDISEKQIALARKHVPEGRFLVGDMMSILKSAYTADAVVSFYAIIHVPRTLHRELFQKIHTLLRKSGYLLVTMGTRDWEGTEENFHGVRMYWSHYGLERNRHMIKECGFEILIDEIDTSGGEKHQVILVRKR